MVHIDVQYEGSKICQLTHEAGPVIQTDAPKDIGGNASAFSPTDLVAAGLASCILTTIGMFAERHGVDIAGSTASVDKTMGTDPRRISNLPVVVTLPASIDENLRPALERAGRLCPVHASLHPDIDAPITYRYQ